MKKETNKTEKSERMLLHIDKDVTKNTRKTLDAIFSEIDKIKLKFLSLEVPWNREQFQRLMSEGSNFVTEFLFAILDKKYEGLAAAAVGKLTATEKPILAGLVTPLEPIITRIKELLVNIELTAEQIPFNVLHDPIINEKLKDYLAEKSKVYAQNASEIAFYKQLGKTAEALNALEQLISESENYPAFLTEEIFQLEMLNRPPVQPYFKLNEENGFNTVSVNPEVFQLIAFNVNRQEKFFADGGRIAIGIQPDKSKVDDDIEAASFRAQLPKNTGQMIDDFINDTDPNKKPPSQSRWKGVGDA